MNASRFDVLVVGAGPAGSVAALVLARAGARVALLDKAAFPHDKACGDVIGPRGVQVLRDLGLPAPAGVRVGPMLVVGPTRRQVHLPCVAGSTYPDHGVAALRTAFDASLQAAAVEAGAVELIGRANQPLWSSGRLDGFETGEGHAVRADFIIGADGATSRVATVTGLVDENRVLWGFAVRTYHPQPVDVPAIVLWEPSTWQGFPGYGWIFPGACGGANIGLGVGAQSDRTVGLRAVRALPAFLTHLRRLGLLSDGALVPSGRQLGGWLKMGMVGTRLAAGRVLLVGDAAGLVNPLQGEGIAQAMQSGKWAAAAVLDEMGGGRGGGAGSSYRASVMAAHLPYQRITSALQGVLLGRPLAIAVLARSLTLLAHGNALTGGWSLFWSELLDGAPPGSPRTVATVLTRLGDYLTARTAVARWFDWESAFTAGDAGLVPATRSGVSSGSSQT